MEILIRGNQLSSDQIIETISNCNGNCNSDANWCPYNPDTNCWDDGD